MAMNIGPSSGNGRHGEPDVMLDINTTPLIDVMLVLIIMLIITIPIQLHSVNLQMSAASKPPPTQPAVVNLAIAADGSLRWNDEVLPDRAALEAHLKAAAAQADQPELRIRPEAQTEYRAVAAVLASAQRLGLSKLGMVGNERFLLPVQAAR